MGSLEKSPSPSLAAFSIARDCGGQGAFLCRLAWARRRCLAASRIRCSNRLHTRMKSAIAGLRSWSVNSKSGRKVWSHSSITVPPPLVLTTLAASREDENGCWVMPARDRPKTRFRGRQVASARFVYCVLNRAVIGTSTVVRHRCHNHRCVNPDHLTEGSRADNKRDDWDYWANGVDYNLL